MSVSVVLAATKEPAMTPRPVPTHRDPKALRLLDPVIVRFKRLPVPVVLPVPVTGLTPVLRNWLRTR